MSGNVYICVGGVFIPCRDTMLNTKETVFVRVKFTFTSFGMVNNIDSSMKS